MDVASYLRQARYIAEELRTAGHTISVANFNAITYNNLPSYFSNIIAALSTRPTRVSFPELLSIMLGHEIHLQTTQATLSTLLPTPTTPLLPTAPAANLAHSVSSSRGRG